MPGEITRPDPMYVQLAGRLADAIASGEYAPGAQLPSETQLMERYGVSRPTVRQAVAELRNMRLVESHHGKGSFVTQRSTPGLTLPRTVRRTGKRYTPDSDLTEIEAPAIIRTHLTAEDAATLEREEEAAAFAVDRLLTDPATGTRAAHRTVIPFDVADENTLLALNPDTDPADIYALLTEAGHALTWSETVSAHIALPDERSSLQAEAGAPVLVTRRVTSTAESRPLILEETRTSAAHVQFRFRVIPEKAPAKGRN
ncbi:GntR family transcriptional regulator [Streptomyces sp. NPDC051018]|uniref:GntR family transcriptional regulator n=1 Tax=Streptomyces sp. NPDC051018 TaxID=3365639 RepID=UPI0037A69594